MFETIYLPSQRVRKGIVITTAGLSRFRNNPGIISQYPSRAYQSGITKVQDSIQTSSAAVIAAAAPFSIPIRNASYNLNADPNALYRTPRSGLLWRVVGKEGDDVKNETRKIPKGIAPSKPTWPLKTYENDLKKWQDFINYGNKSFYFEKLSLANILAQHPVRQLPAEIAESLILYKEADVIKAIDKVEGNVTDRDTMLYAYKREFKQLQDKFLHKWAAKLEELHL